MKRSVLLQEMALSYQPSIASLGAMARLQSREKTLLPLIWLQLVDDKDDLVKSRSVDGLLEFINEPIVEHKLRLMVLQAANEQVKRNSRDKADGIRELVRSSSFSITQRVVTQIIDLVFEDDVYSHSERLAVRYLFESSEVTLQVTLALLYLSRFESVVNDPSWSIFALRFCVHSTRIPALKAMSPFSICSLRP